MSDRPQPPHVLARRDVLNMHWPRHPARFTTREPGIPVTARIVWQDDGIEYLHGTATRWDGEHIYVELVDRRLSGNGVWLRPADVYRAAPDDGSCHTDSGTSR